MMAPNPDTGVHHFCDAPMKLYERTDQENALHECYRRHLFLKPDQARHPEVVLVSGPSGTGKTSLVRTMEEPVESDGGLFISGKFDQLLSPEPYAPLVAAFAELVRKIKAEGETLVTELRQAIRNAVDGDAHLLTDMIPDLEGIIGDVERMTDKNSLLGSESITHFTAVFRNFCRAVCSKKSIVLFIDDLQWADASSLDLIACLVKDTQNRGLLVLGSSRDNVHIDSALSKKLRELENENVVITNICVRSLSRQAVGELLRGSYNMDKEESISLLESVYDKTNGNAFFIAEYLEHLCASGRLSLNLQSTRWEFDNACIESQPFSKENNQDLVAMVKSRMSKLPSGVQQFLKVSACLGTKIETSLIRCVVSESFEDYLSVAEKRGIISFDVRLDAYAFAHDRFQQAAYALIPVHGRQAFHEKIGRNLLKSLSDDELERNIFVVMDQLRHGSDAITDEGERHDVAKLSLTAGRRAINSSGFQKAAEYLDFGIGLLGLNHWQTEYDLSLALASSAAEVYLAIADFERVDQLIESVFLHARSFNDKLRAHYVEVSALGAQDKRPLATKKGLEVLRKLGEPFPRKVTRAYLVKDVIKTKRLLRNKSDEALMRLPLMANPDKVAAMIMLNIVFFNTYTTRSDFLPVIWTRMVQLTVIFGLSAVSSVGFVGYGIMLSSVMGDTRAGYRYGRLALSMLEKFKVREYIPRVFVGFFGCIAINHSNESLARSTDSLTYAHKVGLETGDTEFSFLAAFMCCTQTLHQNMPLDQLEAQVRSNCELAEHYKQDAALAMSQPFHQYVLNLMGKADDALVLTGEVFNEQNGLANAVENNNMLSVQSITYDKMTLAYLFGDYVVAGKMADRCREVDKVAVGTLLIPFWLLYDGLTCVSLAQMGVSRKKRLSRARVDIKKLKKLSLGAPENYLDKLYLLQAEYSACVGDYDRALAKYASAISMSTSQEFLHIQALSNERAGRFLIRRGNCSKAIEYLQQAYSTYIAWGALGKAKHLKSEFRFIK